MSEANSKLPNLTAKTEEFISVLESQENVPLYTMSADKARKFLDNLQEKYHKNIPADVEDTTILTEDSGYVDIRVVRPKDIQEKLPAILYVHGGGWVLGGKDSFDMLIKKIAIRCNAAVIFPDYSRSPEGQFPKALNEIYSILEYIYKNSGQFNIDSEKIAIAGDSAGGNMAVVTAMKSKNKKGPKLSYMCLFYPVTNAGMDTKSYELFEDGPWLSKKAMEWFWDAYVPEKKLRNDAYVSPIQAAETDLQGLPPALIITAENDVLRDEGEAFATKLDSAGQEVLCVRINGTIHDFLLLNALSDTEPAIGALELACGMLKKHLI